VQAEKAHPGPRICTKSNGRQPMTGNMLKHVERHQRLRSSVKAGIGEGLFKEDAKWHYEQSGLRFFRAHESQSLRESEGLKKPPLRKKKQKKKKKKKQGKEG